jgi:hypothetical protein
MPDLDSVTDELFETELGIDGRAVTLQFIREGRASRDYPLDHTTQMGGRTADGLEELTRAEVDAALKEVDDLVAEFGLG